LIIRIFFFIYPCLILFLLDFLLIIITNRLTWRSPSYKYINTIIQSFYYHLDQIVMQVEALAEYHIIMKTGSGERRSGRDWTLLASLFIHSSPCFFFRICCSFKWDEPGHFIVDNIKKVKIYMIFISPNKNDENNYAKTWRPGLKSE
jgi:hypothetical protein